tara:strand:+ start:95 stop:1672 length:1578 start_codon:yes stop_codon:yes gene_type:complete
MYLKKNYVVYFLLFILFAFVTLYLNPNFDFSLNSLKHWSTYNRDDIVFVYGTLIYNEGYDQHHLDHPSLFTFIFTSLFYKVFYFFGFLDHYTLSGFIQSEEDTNLSLSKLFFVSKMTILFFSAFTIIILNRILFFLCSNQFNSFIISCLFIFSTGFISASNRLESGLISLFLIFLSIYFFLKFINSKKKAEVIFFIMGFIFLFSSMMQKKIIYFSIPFLLLSFVPILKKNNINYIDYSSINRLLNYKILLFFIYLVVIAFISYKTLINNTFFLSRDLDFIFLILNFVGLNTILFFYIKYFQNSHYQNLLTYNILIGSTYLIYKYFLIYFFSAPVAIWSISFTNFMGHLNMFVSGDVKGELSFNSLILYLFSFVKHFKFVLGKYLFAFSYQSVLLWINLITFMYYFNKIENIKKKIIILLLFGFLFIQAIILFRYEQDTYFLNSEILLIIPLIYLLQYLRLNKIIIFLLIFFISLSNLNLIKSIKHANSQSYCNSIFKDKNYIRYYDYWTKHIPKSVVLNFCNDRL